MSSEVEWVLAQLKSVVDAQPADHPLKRVNRNDSDTLDGNIHDRTGNLRVANYVGVGGGDRSSTPVGTEYDRRLETTVGVRIEGMHHHERGHIDPDGTNAVAFDTLVHDVRDAIDAGLEFPSVGASNINYHTAYIENETNRSSNYADFYEYRFDVRFVGYETRS